jgi:hypothetical protein
LPGGSRAGRVYRAGWGAWTCTALALSADRDAVAAYNRGVGRLLRLEEGSLHAVARLQPQLWRVGGSDAQRDVVEGTRICALIRAGRTAEARTLIDRRMDRRPCRRDRWWRAQAQSTGTRPGATDTFLPGSGD